MKHVAVELWRKKLGRVRVLFTVDKVSKQVIIRLVDLRDDDTYDSKKLDKREVAPVLRAGFFEN